MSHLIDSKIVLSLNRNWQVIGELTVGEAVIALAGGGQDGGHPAYAMDIDLAPDGSLINATPTPWELWIKLPVRKHDLAIMSSRGAIRAPTVVIQRNYNKVPMKRPRLSRRAIWERDGATCQYTGRKLTHATANLDHVVPKSRGGKDDWENLVLADVKVNTAKGSKTNAEAGLKLLRAPKAPPAIPVSISITDIRHETWRPFLIR
jgi:5-methylcytosine-specific restriction endonuclease McrA